MAQIQIRKLAKKEEGEKKVEEGLEGYTEILQDISNCADSVCTIKLVSFCCVNLSQ